MSNIEFTLDPEVVFILLREGDAEYDEDDTDLIDILDRYSLKQNDIVGHDEYDGGTEYEIVIYDKLDQTYWRALYNSWDILEPHAYHTKYEDTMSLNLNWYQVEPQEITKTIYKSIE